MQGLMFGRELLLVLFSLASAKPWPETSGGSVIGITLPAAGGVEVDQFLGVPFATAKRFEPPMDFHGPYPGRKVAAAMWGPACMQVAGDPTQTYGSEDCLKANVWSPHRAWEADNKLPVMVFIYGGSNQFGEAEPYNMQLGGANPLLKARVFLRRIVCDFLCYATCRASHDLPWPQPPQMKQAT